MRISKKNIKMFRGKPLISYVIEEIKKAGVPHVFVGTDDQEIRQVAEGCGAIVLNMTEAEAAGDMTATDVADFLTRDARGLGYSFDHFLLAYGTSVFSTAEDIRAGYELIIKTGANAVVPVTTYDFPPLRAFMINPKTNNLYMVNPQFEFTHHQNLPEMFHDAGQWYWLDRRKFAVHRRVFQPVTQALVLDRNRIQDIDTLEDWERAEQIYDQLVREGKR